jgi:hypothetical protein
MAMLGICASARYQAHAMVIGPHNSDITGIIHEGQILANVP